jgi:hypothetical protein
LEGFDMGFLFLVLFEGVQLDVVTTSDEVPVVVVGKGLSLLV